MKKLITSALPYVNNQPHLGNIVGSVLSGDVYNRYCRMKGEESMYICGTDEYGTAIEMEAIAQGTTPQEICKKNREIHKSVYEWFGIRFDQFGHTSSPSHTELVQQLFMKMYNNGYFKEEEIEQFYCEHCKLFLADRYVIGECKFCGDSQARGDQCDACGHSYKSTDLLIPQCSICNSNPVIRKTNHLFFDLARFKPRLEELYKAKGQQWSQNAQNIFNQWMAIDLYPRCMTRDLKFKWGVPVPLEAFKEKVFYVWFDAPIGYLTFLKDLVGDCFEDWCREAELVQFMGKDNVCFHTVIFPAMLIATGDKLPLVSRLSATEYLQFENKKFSKSRRHGIFGLDLVDGKLGKVCLWRYYLMKIRPEGTKDANFSFYDFQKSVSGDLINNLGNFVNRVLKYIKQKCAGQVRIETLDERDTKCVTVVNELFERYRERMDEIKLRDGLQMVFEVSRIGNEYVQEGVGDASRRSHCFCFGFSLVVHLAKMMHPFIPESSMRMLKMCEIEYVEPKLDMEMKVFYEHSICDDIEPLFENFSPEQIEEMTKYG
ncbi:methionyl-tRNA synthetase [Ordospora colligata]|uniref:methionine--tRNA ligase n=1 Tax=Ordospora colligata OC4 TaxID=1354746 RepID=A0A0B2UIR2_9MICR|nr:methionyl-tRNA synthetase [Ordospora colligata OC4]KHN68855.1 methionyl-tRNA synthetase [Ordospora colligata OC4]TBU13889.1 methionyl-tRNA synthetase [Ordospora colligata]TBU14078.1 methionyl-tRNA synthetase [Ordospora colligata]TBU17747.1 methionyl-tRNA synthetase [Ordospora colligata]